jgi:hypothetical protein
MRERYDGDGRDEFGQIIVQEAHDQRPGTEDGRIDRENAEKTGAGSTKRSYPGRSDAPRRPRKLRCGVDGRRVRDASARDQPRREAEVDGCTPGGEPHHHQTFATAEKIRIARGMAASSNLSSNST